MKALSSCYRKVASKLLWKRLISTSNDKFCGLGIGTKIGKNEYDENGSIKKSKVYEIRGIKNTETYKVRDIITNEEDTVSENEGNLLISIFDRNEYYLESSLGPIGDNESCLALWCNKDSLEYTDSYYSAYCTGTNNNNTLVRIAYEYTSDEHKETVVLPSNVQIGNEWYPSVIRIAPIHNNISHMNLKSLISNYIENKKDNNSTEIIAFLTFCNENKINLNELMRMWRFKYEARDFVGNSANIVIDSSGVLSATCKNKNGGIVSATLNLCDYIGNNNGEYAIPGNNFELSATNIHAGVIDDQTCELVADLKNDDDQYNEKKIDVNVHIVNQDGVLVWND